MLQNTQLEQSVLSCMIQDYRNAKEYELLSENDFVLDFHRQIFGAIKELIKERKAVDHLMLYEKMNQTVKLTDLIALSDCEPTTVNFKRYATELKAITTRRNYFYLAQEIMERAKSGEEVSEFAEKNVFKLNENIETGEFTDAKDLYMPVIDEIEERYKTDELPGIATGFPAIDKMTNGLKKQELIFLAARPSMGKTALGINICQNTAIKNKVAIFSLEMPKEQLIERMIRSEGIIPDSKIREKNMEQDDWRRLTDAAGELYRRNIYIDDRAGRTVPQMKSMCRKLKRKKGLDLILIDYLQMIRPTEGNSRREQVENISRDLKGMAKELDCPVVCISSLSRANEQRQNKKPILSDLRETGQIEYDADAVIFIHREEYYEPKPENRGEAEIIFAKQRNGPVGVAKLGWIAECTKFVNYEQLERCWRD